jgi:S1-C subfamily serine protease
MEETFEKRMADALRNVDSLKTADCLDSTVIGLYAENELSQEQRSKVEDHLQSCLYCVKQLNDMKELLHYHGQWTPISDELFDRLNALCSNPEKATEKPGAIASLMQTTKTALTFPIRQWKYPAVSFASAFVAILIVIFVMRSENPALVIPQVDAKSFVDIKAVSDDGKVLNETQGVILDSHGLIASNLYRLVGASILQIALRDGRTYQTRNIWKDDDKNLAVMRIDDVVLKPIPTADVRQIRIGESVFIVANPAVRTGFKESLVSDFKQVPGRRKAGSIQYIQLASLSKSVTQGALIDRQGRLIGFLVTEEKNINLAAPITDAERLPKEGRAIPLSELKNSNFSVDALNFYLKGILARDAQRWDEAIAFFKKALELNPNLEGTHIELGYLYYKRRLYDLEAREYEAALRINPDNSDALSSLGTNLETRGLYAEAIEKYERALALDPEDAETMYELGVAYLMQGRKDKALEVSSRLRRLDPGYGEVLYRLSKK